MEQEYYLNDGAAIYNCNICGDVQLIMVGDGESLPESGCKNPDCESNKNREPDKGMKLKFIEYTKKTKE